MEDRSLEIFLGLSTVSFAALFIRSRFALKKQRQVTHELVQKRDTLITERNNLINKLELESLKFQVSPHSLRNTLSVVKYFTETTNDAVDRLTKVLDFLLYESSVDLISLKDELKFIQNFHELMKIRTSALVIKEFRENISGNTFAEKLQVPPLITAYFLENAYKHGELSKPGVINISLTYNEYRQLVYEVENTVNSEPKQIDSTGGIGLQNMKKRLNILFKDHYSLEGGRDGDLYRAILRINF